MGSDQAKAQKTVENVTLWLQVLDCINKQYMSKIQYFVLETEIRLIEVIVHSDPFKTWHHPSTRLDVHYRWPLSYLAFLMLW